MSAHQFDPQRRPDFEFETGEFKHVVCGNRGRLLDPRRTPVRIVELREPTGSFVVEILDFEDAGARWEVALEDVGHYQFEKTGTVAVPEAVRTLCDLAGRFGKPLHIAIDAEAQAATLKRLQAATDHARAWLDAHSTHFAAQRTVDVADRHGSRLLADDMQSYLAEQDLATMDDLFATQFVRNPSSGEMIKGHRIVLAGLGLVAYDGKIVRDPAIFDGQWSKELRARHLIARLAFVRGFLSLADRPTLTVYRGISCDGPPEPPINKTFVSTSTDFEVAKSCSGETDPAATGVIYRQKVPGERVFMTYIETAQMNEHYQESEVVLLFDPNNRVF